ncbi:MAG: hypothetical protein HZB61_12545 [Nitrospirae bacterium]|nr:hypothetical protein [Nitrospirota bacterium]
MKKILTVVLSLIFVFAVTSMSFAADKTAPAAPAMEQKAAPAKKEAAKHVQVTGEITAVDAAAKTLTVKGKKGDVAISVDDKTKIMAGKDMKTLADLKTGEKVTVKYTEADGKNTAKSIDVKAAHVKKEMSPAMEKKK